MVMALISAQAFSQTVVKGKILDSQSYAPEVGAVVQVFDGQPADGRAVGYAMSDSLGAFAIKVAAGRIASEGTVQVMNLGRKTLEYSIKPAPEVDLGVIYMADEVEPARVNFIAAVQAMNTRVGNSSPAYSWPSPMEFVMNFPLATGSESLAANFFGFTKSLPYVRGLWEKGREYGSKGVIRFKNYDLEGTLSTPCVEYTYDLDTKVLSYQKFIEVTVS